MTDQDTATTIQRLRGLTYQQGDMIAELELEVERLRARIEAWEPIVLAAQLLHERCNAGEHASRTRAVDAAILALPAEHHPAQPSAEPEPEPKRERRCGTCGHWRADGPWGVCRKGEFVFRSTNSLSCCPDWQPKGGSDE